MTSGGRVVASKRAVLKFDIGRRTTQSPGSPGLEQVVRRIVEIHVLESLRPAWTAVPKKVFALSAYLRTTAKSCTLNFNISKGYVVGGSDIQSRNGWMQGVIHLEAMTRLGCAAILPVHHPVVCTEDHRGRKHRLAAGVARLKTRVRTVVGSRCLFDGNHGCATVGGVEAVRAVAAVCQEIGIAA